MCVHVERVMYVHVERVILCLYTKSVNVYADGIMNEGEKLSLVWIRSQHHKSSAVTVSLEFPERRNQCQLMSSDRVILTNPIPGP